MNDIKRDRRIVTWTPQEDNILREQIRIHGTESWSNIAAQFNDKTGRQCRRRWYTYLNSECKKGSWTEDEDIVLCQAQKLLGNRWTEIAKVVSGRTDNAVKNRFTTLCKKRAKLELLSKENRENFNQSKERDIIQDRSVAAGNLEAVAPLKKIRTLASNLEAKCKIDVSHFKEHVTEKHMNSRPPLAALDQNSDVRKVPVQQKHGIPSKTMDVIPQSTDQGMFLKKDDPKITALMQQAELLSSLAEKVNAEKNNESIENAWNELHDFRSETELMRCKILEMDFSLEKFKNSVEDRSSSNAENRQSFRLFDLQDESLGSSEYSTGSTNQWRLTGQGNEGNQSVINSSTSIMTQAYARQPENVDDYREGFCINASIAEATILPSADGQLNNDGVGSIENRLIAEFTSPTQMIPFSQPFAQGIPSPKFTDSERQFLLRTFGLASPSTNANSNPSTFGLASPSTNANSNPSTVGLASPSTNANSNPSCKRALLHSL